MSAAGFEPTLGLTYTRWNDHFYHALKLLHVNRDRIRRF
jgi:hypothetical protein